MPTITKCYGASLKEPKRAINFRTQIYVSSSKIGNIAINSHAYNPWMSCSPWLKRRYQRAELTKAIFCQILHSFNYCSDSNPLRSHWYHWITVAKTVNYLIFIQLLKDQEPEVIKQLPCLGRDCPLSRALNEVLSSLVRAMGEHLARFFRA